MIVVPEAHAYDYLWNNSGSYNFISGPLANITLLTGLAVFLKKHNCHVKHCYRLSWQEHPGHGHPVCKHHFPQEHLPDLSRAAHKNPRKAHPHAAAAAHKVGRAAHPRHAASPADSE